MAATRPITSLRADSRARAMRLARSCYDHVAGHLGVAVFGSLLDRGAVEGGDGRHHPAGKRAARPIVRARLGHRLFDHRVRTGFADPFAFDTDTLARPPA